MVNERWSRLHLSDAVAYRIIGGHIAAFIMDKRKTKYLLADGITVDIIQFLANGKKYEELIEFLTNLYDVSIDELQTDVENIVNCLTTEGVLIFETPVRNTDFCTVITGKSEYALSTQSDHKIVDNMYSLAKTHNKPFKVFWEITYRCTHKCRHCYLDLATIQQANLSGFSNDFPTERALTLLDEMAEEGVLDLVITGGEASLHPGFIRILTRATFLRFGVSVLTNGDLLSSEVLEALSCLPIKQISIPIYGDENIHDNFVNRPGAFKQTLRNVQLLHTNGANVGITGVLTKGSLDTLKENKRVFNDMGIEYEISPLIFPTAQGGHEPARERATSEEIIEACKDLGIRTQRHQCIAGISRFRVTPAGEVNPCEMLRNTSYGNVLTKRFGEVMKSEDRTKWICDFDQLIMAKTQQCSSCGIRQHCTDCLGLGMVENGDMISLSKEACRLAHSSYSVWG